MKSSLVYVQTTKDEWCEKALSVYTGKIGRTLPFEIKPLKSDNSSRRNREKKISVEDERCLKQINSQDLVLAFDEGGRSFSDSREFSSYLVKKMEMGRSR